MHAILILAALTVAVTAPAAAQQATPFPGFRCDLLAARQPLPGSSSTDFRVVKLTYAPGAVGAEHRHRYGEILYLLSGSGTSASGNVVTTLSKHRALVIPAQTYHTLNPTGPFGMSVLSVQFPSAHDEGFTPRHPSGPDVCLRHA